MRALKAVTLIGILALFMMTGIAMAQQMPNPYGPNVNLATAKKAEKWVVGNDIPAPASAPAPTPAAATGTLPEPVAISVDFAAPEPEPEEEAPTPVEKDDLTITGEIAAVSKTGKGVRIGDVWYNVTTRTKKNVEPEKGKTVKIKYVQGNSGFLVETIDPA